MATIADSIQARIDALGYPTDATHPDAGERRVAQHNRRDTVRAIENDFAVQLADTYLDAISPSRRQEIGSLIYDLAWVDGHDSGYLNIEDRYSELAETAVRIYAIATS